MIENLNIIRAEMYKQFKHTFHNGLVVFSMLLWPLLSFATAYYQFKPFKFDAILSTLQYLDEASLITFIMIGYFAMIFFRSLVESAWRFSFERTSGTLELIFMSPANRLVLIFANALASLISNVWMFSIFMIGIFGFTNTLEITNPGMVVFGLLLMVVMAVLWGMFLNSMFIFTRDSSFLFTILEEPMELFGGVKIPVQLFPLWAKTIAGVFPLTYAIKLLRQIVFLGSAFSDVKGLIYTSVIICITMFLGTIIMLKLGEKSNRKTGNMALF